ncbi:hypothetical protein ONA92_26845 [Mycobacteroides salmoniphilum]|uniref:hypothetical protein n=1 Tax=Mycobacteroides salmoniphilum TaxID=404941 RepID=UPI00356974F6
MKEIDAAIEAAAAEHRRKLGELAVCAKEIEEVDRQIDELTERRSGLVSTYGDLHSELTSGRTAGAALAALGLKAPAAGGGSRANRAAKKSNGSARKSSAGKTSAVAALGKSARGSAVGGDSAGQIDAGSPSSGGEASGAPAPEREPAAV